MKLNDVSLPYPVLGISDDIDPGLPADSVKVECRTDKQNFVFEISLTFNNRDIRGLIERGKAEYTCEMECQRTFLRRCVRSSQPMFTIEVSRHEVYGRINLNCYVSVKQPIPNYTNRGFHADYQGCHFDMEPGDLLVAFPPCHYDTDISYDRLQSAGSYMQIVRNEGVDFVLFDISGDKILINLPAVLYKLYCSSAVRGAMETMHASLALNAMTYALMQWAKGEVGEECLWVRSIAYRLCNEDSFKGLSELDNTDKIPVLAQRLLNDPYGRLFKMLSHVANDMDDNEE